MTPPKKRNQDRRKPRESTFNATPEQLEILRILREKKPRKYQTLLQDLCEIINVYDGRNGISKAIKHTNSTDTVVNAESLIIDESGNLVVEILETRTHWVPLTNVPLSDETLKEVGKRIGRGLEPRQYTGSTRSFKADWFSK